MRPSTLRARGFLLALALLFAPVAALAHSLLQASAPASGEHLDRVPTELRLRFNEPVELAFARLTLEGPEQAPVALGALGTDPDSSRVLVAAIAGQLAAGPYTVRWQIAGADGHPVRGEFPFVIAPGAAGLAPATTATAPAHVGATHHDPIALPTGPGFDAGSPLYAAVRWLTFLGLLGAIGAAAFATLVLRPAVWTGADPNGALVGPARLRAAAIGAAAAVLVMVAAALRLAAQGYAMHGPGAALDPALLGPMLTRTVWGWGWVLQVTAAAVALAGFLLARRGTVGWGVAAAGALALAFSPGLSGHAAAMGDLAAPAVVADGLHVLGAGGWLGGLLLLVGVGLPAAARLPAERRAVAVARLVNAFSPTALAFAGLVVATGVFASWLHLGSPADLWQTGYGRTLLLKLALLSLLFATGAYNWLRVRPALSAGSATGRLRSSATVELLVGAVVLAVTAVLVATSPAGS